MAKTDTESKGHAVETQNVSKEKPGSERAAADSMVDKTVRGSTEENTEPAAKPFFSTMDGEEAKDLAGIYNDMTRAFDERKKQLSYMEDTLRKRTAILDSERSALNKAMEKFDTDSAKLQADIRTMEEERKELNEGWKNFTEKEKALGERERELADRSGKQDKREAELNQRESDLDNRENIVQASAKLLDDKRENLRNDEAGLVKREKAAKEREDKLDTLSVSLDNRQKKLDLEKERMNVEQENIKLKEMNLDEREKAIAEMESSSRAGITGIVQEENDQLTTRIQKLEADNNSLSSERDILAKRLSKATEELKSTEKRLYKALNSAKEREEKEEMERVREEADAAMARLDTMGEELQAAKDEAERLRNENERLLQMQAEAEEKASSGEEARAIDIISLKNDFREIDFRETEAGVFESDYGGISIVIHADGGLYRIGRSLAKPNAKKLLPKVNEMNINTSGQRYTLNDRQILCEGMIRDDWKENLRDALSRIASIR